MKKLTRTIFLIFVLSVSAFAEGTMHTGGRTCPPNETCFTASAEPGRTSEKKESREPTGLTRTIFKDIFDFLQSLFV